MPGRSRGQQLALDQLAAISRASEGNVVVGDLSEPTDADPRLIVDVSFRCAGIEHKSGGIRLHARERFHIAVPREFPYVMAKARTTHRRWAGTAHVHWGRLLCLYQAASEWDPGDGMY